jgi:hypothetical protein
MDFVLPIEARMIGDGPDDVDRDRPSGAPEVAAKTTIAAPSRTVLVDLQGFALEDNFAVNDDPVATTDAAAEDVTARDGPGRARAGGPGEDVHVAWLRELTALHDMTAYAPAPRRRPQPPIGGLKPAARRLEPAEAIPPIKVETFPGFLAVSRLALAEAMHLATEAMRRSKDLIQPFLSLPALRRLGPADAMHLATEAMRRIKARIQPFLTLPAIRRPGAAETLHLATEPMRRIKAHIRPFLRLPAGGRPGAAETLHIASEAMRRIEAGILPRIRRLASPLRISVIAKGNKPLVLLRTATSILRALPAHLWAQLRTTDMFDRIMLAVLAAAAIAYLGALRISAGATAVTTDKAPSSLVARPAPPHVRER